MYYILCSQRFICSTDHLAIMISSRSLSLCMSLFSDEPVWGLMMDRRYKPKDNKRELQGDMPKCAR